MKNKEYITHIEIGKRIMNPIVKEEINIIGIKIFEISFCFLLK